ncbi:MAG: hypothetical protein GF418_06200 [Chitinivibrionales bacterium]|nr:hypothetical protein [Chitinivibrionales bacterium]MBD3395203.1 hypothetical protein [Chitinivibrionales bacterium]
MFYMLLLVTFMVALLSCFVVVTVFNKPVGQILKRIIADDISSAWLKYITFAVYVVGISGGVRIWDLEKYITARANDGEPLVLTMQRWTLEIYRTLIGSLQSMAWVLLVFFVFALIAYVIVRAFESRPGRTHDRAR